ncbi:MAG: ABC transporter ATP-binding protein [Candidatus Kerfeldbacteria bacterium]|jgi:homopolymeric O-antigen transport system ATP-binding protein
MNQQEPIIKVENISKSYIISHNANYDTMRDKVTEFIKKPFEILTKKKAKQSKEIFWALKNINFSINKGERIGIIGKNGAGKSTLLKILSQITHPTTGKIELNGRVASLLEVGTGFHPELTGRENIFLNGAILGMKRLEIKEKFDEIVEFSEIGNFLDTPVKRYSSGMFVRLAFSVAAHLEPEILIVDEVLAVGDIEFQKKCLGKMESVANKGRTIIFVSHNMNAISSLCDRSILINNGKIQIDGKTNKVIEEYLKNKNSNTSGKFNLSNPALRKNSLPNSMFKWKSVKFINSQKEITNSIKLYEKFSMVLTAEIQKDITELNLSFRIVNQLGISLFNIHTSDTNLPSKFNKGEVSFKIDFKNNYFPPGSYFIDFGANGLGVIDWIPDAAELIIEQTGNNGEHIRSNFNGVILHPCSWEILK